jgi:hypothetical protein
MEEPEDPMIAIRIPRAEWGKAWRAMIEIAPVRLVAGDPIYEVLPAHLELLKARGYSYEAVKPPLGKSEKRGEPCWDLSMLLPDD